MPTSDREWAAAYARQALSDVQALEFLPRAQADKCHRLHFLQMAAEKVCRAHLTANNGHERVRKTHGYIARNLPVVAREFYSRHRSGGLAAWQLAGIRKVSFEIQVASPASDNSDSREDNSEYPWLDGQGTIQTPCLYAFPNLDDGAPAVRLILRLLRVAAESYIKSS